MKKLLLVLIILTTYLQPVRAKGDQELPSPQSTLYNSVVFVGTATCKAILNTAVNPVEKMKTMIQANPTKVNPWDLFKDMLKRPREMYRGSGPFFGINYSKALCQGQILAFYQDIFTMFFPELKGNLAAESAFGASMLSVFNTAWLTPQENLKSLQMTSRGADVKKYTLSGFIKGRSMNSLQKMRFLLRGAGLVAIEGWSGWGSFLLIWGILNKKAEQHWGKNNVPFYANLAIFVTMPIVDALSTQPFQCLKTRLQVANVDPKLANASLLGKFRYTYNRYGFWNGFYTGWKGLKVALIASSALTVMDMVGLWMTGK